MQYDLWYFSKDLIYCVSYDYKLSLKLNRFCGYLYDKGAIQEGDEPVFKVPASQWIKLNKLLKG